MLRILQIKNNNFLLILLQYINHNIKSFKFWQQQSAMILKYAEKPGKADNWKELQEAPVPI